MENAFSPDRRTLLRLTWPIFIELVLQMLMGNVDQIMISHYSDTAVAAVGNANQILNFLILTFNVLCTASIILITQYRGAGDKKRAEQVYSVAFFTNLLISAAISLFIFLFNKPVFRLMQVPADVLPQSSLYIIITGGFIFLQAMSLTFSAFLRSNAFMVQSMIASIAINLVNIVGNAMLINGIGPVPALGVAGVAISTTVSRAIGVLVLYRMFRKYVGGHISIRALRPFPRDLLKKLLGIGLPSAGENFAYSLSQITILSFINLFGTAVITTKVYASMLAMVSYIFASAITQATQVIIGHLLGARRVDETHRQVMSTLRASMLISFLASLTLCVFARPLFSMFTDNAEVIALGQKIMFIELFLEQGRAVNICFVRCLQTAGDIRFPVTIGILSTWIVAVGLSWVLGVGLQLGIVGIWCAMATDECLRAVLFILRWRAGGWRSKNLIAS